MDHSLFQQYASSGMLGGPRSLAWPSQFPPTNSSTGISPSQSIKQLNAMPGLPRSAAASTMYAVPISWMPQMYSVPQWSMASLPSTSVWSSSPSVPNVAPMTLNPQSTQRAPSLVNKPAPASTCTVATDAWSSIACSFQDSLSPGLSYGGLMPQQQQGHHHQPSGVNMNSLSTRSFRTEPSQASVHQLLSLSTAADRQAGLHHVPEAAVKAETSGLKGVYGADDMNLRLTANTSSNALANSLHQPRSTATPTRVTQDDNAHQQQQHQEGPPPPAGDDSFEYKPFGRRRKSGKRRRDGESDDESQYEPESEDSGSIASQELADRRPKKRHRSGTDGGGGTSAASSGGGGAGRRSTSFKCTRCPKSFSRPFGLKLHMRVHTGERPFQCSVPACTKSFAQSCNRLRHERQHHKNLQAALEATSPGTGTGTTAATPQAGQEPDAEATHTTSPPPAAE